MKKLIKILLSMIMMISISACKSSKEKKYVTEEEFVSAVGSYKGYKYYGIDHLAGIWLDARDESLIWISVAQKIESSSSKDEYCIASCAFGIDGTVSDLDDCKLERISEDHFTLTINNVSYVLDTNPDDTISFHK